MKLWTDGENHIAHYERNTVAWKGQEVVHWYTGDRVERHRALWDLHTRPREFPRVRMEAVEGGFAVFESGRTRPSTWLPRPDSRTYEGWVDVAGLTHDPLSWHGPSGPLKLSALLVHRGGDRSGLRIRVLEASGVVFQSATLEDVDAAFEHGVADFPHAPLQAGRPLRLVVEGRALGSASVSFDLGTREFEPFDPERPERELAVTEVSLGTLVASIEVEESSVVLRRGEVHLGFRSEWLAPLVRAGVVDPDARTPNLDRWLRRALARCRVRSREEAPEAVDAEWLDMSRRDRTFGSPIPAFVFSGGVWEVDEAGARALREHFGSAHPLGAFATAAFTIDGPAHSPTAT